VAIASSFISNTNQLILSLLPVSFRVVSIYFLVFFQSKWLFLLYLEPRFRHDDHGKDEGRDEEEELGRVDDEPRPDQDPVSGSCVRKNTFS
jgi:hypothetical protein